MIGARIHDGDVVCIRQQESVDNGQIAAVLIDGEEATLKRFYFSDGVVTLQAENPAYPPRVFTGEDVSKVRVLGLATHFISVVR
jgi:repressor LexA